MTVTYSLDVSKIRFLGFTKLLCRWKGSIYKILWREFLVFCAGYAAISVTYRYYLNKRQKENFEKVVIFVETFTDLIPLSFVLGFYVTLVIGRWWSQYEAIPWPDRLCLMIQSYVHGSDERSRMIRRTLGRYLILLQALTFQAVSTSVKRRFPTPEHLVAVGIMTKEELSVFDKVSFVYGKWWLPCHWFSSLATRAKKEGRIKDSILLDALFRELLNYRNSCGTMLGYDWISVPLVYTQVVTLATYLYSVALMVGRQYLDPAKDYTNHQVDLYIPLYTLMQFFFYVGWLKVAEQIVNPYGEDDDDFELNWCLDRSVHLVYLTVDHLHMKHPKVRRDFFWDELEPRLPQTKHSAKYVANPQLGSAFLLDVEDAEYIPTDTLFEQDREENLYVSDSIKNKAVEGYRSSFIMKLFNSGLGNSLRRKSARKSLSHSQGHVNPTFAIGHEKNNPSNRSTPAVSRKSSMRSVIKKVSPSHSRSSSTSFRPGSRHRFKSYDVQEAEKTQYQNGVISDPEGATFYTATPVVRSASVPLGPSVDSVCNAQDTEAGLATDTGLQRLENPMPPIPEEPSRICSITSIEGFKAKEADSSQEVDEVQNLVREASKVLKELNKTVSAQGHRQDCKLKGYESCCFLSSSDSSDSEIIEDLTEINVNEEKLQEISVVIENNKSDKDADFEQTIPSH